MAATNTGILVEDYWKKFESFKQVDTKKYSIINVYKSPFPRIWVVDSYDSGIRIL